jgi:hypothetical protein
VKPRDYKTFIDTMGIAPPPDRQHNLVCSVTRNWALLHPALAALNADKAGLDACKHMMYVELNREEGPRWHIMDRLYKRFSNLRREMETTAMMKLLPDEEVEHA